jgi:transcriptional regulator with XRE-family HTH domain
MTGTDVKAWREARGLSQAQLSERLPVALKTLQGWEQGRGTPPPYIVRALNDLARELSLGTRDAKANMLIMDDVQHLGPDILEATREYIESASDHDEADAGDGEPAPHELAYVSNDDPA